MLLSDSDYEIHVSEEQEGIQSSIYIDLLQNIDLYSAGVLYSSDMKTAEVFNSSSGRLIDAVYICRNTIYHKCLFCHYMCYLPK